jgi:hypothetical protein
MNTDEEKIVRAIRKELEWSPPTMKVTKKGKAFLKDREKTSPLRAEFLIKFASMSDEQFEKWSELETTAEARAFMSAIPMPQMKTNKMFIELEKQEGSKK